MDSFLKSIGSTLEVVGKVLIPKTPTNKDNKEKQTKEEINLSQLAVAGLGLNNNLKPKGAPASIASTGMF